MKAKNIQIGKVYSNGKKGKRKVLDMSDTGAYRLYLSQSDGLTLLYKTIEGNHRNSTGRMTVKRFAAWAKEEVI